MKERKGFDSLQCRTQFCGDVDAGILGKRSEGDTVSPNTDLNLSQESVAKLTRHETSDLFDQASGDRPRSIHTNTSVELKSPGIGTILCDPTSDCT